MSRLLPPAALAALALVALAPLPPASAQTPTSSRPRAAKTAERSAAINSIQTQLKAFGRDDYQTAITYQSAGLKGSFPSTAAFRAMMRRAYPEFAHYKSVTFGPAQCDAQGIHLAIPATVTGKDGVTVRAVYLMVREGKVYRVEGVAGGAQSLPDNGGPSKDV